MILLEAETFWTLLRDLPHWEFELFVSFVETIVFNLVFGLLIWKKLIKPYIEKRKSAIVKEEHALHGITEDH